ncbi:hypothetical protein [Kitasatospora sp. NPDC088346]|uniref:hypothetical protein n=1 Tax=Kitasatospora sp. NPDC088346 TaxID=3364073 RepID=UPI0038197C92
MTGADPFACDRANLVPRIGFSGARMGGEVGKRAIEDYEKAGLEPRRHLCPAGGRTRRTQHVNGTLAARARWVPLKPTRILEHLQADKGLNV